MWTDEYPPDTCDVVLRISAQYGRDPGNNGLITHLELPAVYLTGKQVLSISLTESNKVKVVIRDKEEIPADEQSAT